MKVQKISVRAATGLGLALLASVPACAQSIGLANPSPTLSFAASTDKGMWHTVLIVSAVVGVIGLVDGDSTLAVIGGAGVVLSLAESGGSAFRAQGFHRGLDLVHTGPLSFGIDPLGLSPGFAARRPSAYVHATFKF